jgi:hypothetical protein
MISDRVLIYLPQVPSQKFYKSFGALEEMLPCVDMRNMELFSCGSGICCAIAESLALVSAGTIKLPFVPK